MNIGSNTKIEELLALLSLEEKISMIHGNGLFRTEGVARLGIPPLKMADGPMGVRNEFQNDKWIPVGHTDDYVTYLPSIGALAATWNRKLAYKAGSVLGEEARGRGKDIILAPGINIKRSPLCGRNFEYMSEDPFLSGELAIPFIKGIQEHDVAACVKHFAVNNQETQRLWVEVLVDDRTLQEIYLPAFKAVVKQADTYAMMGAYNLIHGEHCCQSQWLLNGILREQWGYKGVVVSDWGGVHHTKYAAESGLDIEMSVTNDFDQYHMASPLLEAVQQGQIPERYIDEKVRHILMLMDKLQMLDGKRKAGSYNTPEHRQVVAEIASESIVLLKNKTNHLPLNKEKLKKILVVGDNAERIHSNGGGSAEIKALYEISPLMGLKSKLGGNTEVTFTRGYYVPPKSEENETNWQETSLEQVERNTLGEIVTPEIASIRASYLQQALMLAEQADEVVFIGGLNHDHDLEGHDRPDITLPYGQDQLIKELVKIKPELVVVMLCGSPVGMESWLEDVNSLVWMGYAGMESGNALADVLLGYANPSGKLTESFIKKLEDCPAHNIGEFPGGKTVAYKEGIMVGYRYYDTYNVKVSFPFGYGLSYTTFEYSDIAVQLLEESIEVTCMIRNTGACRGAEVAQLYVTQHTPSVTRPKKELKQFEKIYLDKDDQQKVTFVIPKYALGFYNAQAKKWMVEPGTYTLSIGSSSEAIELVAQITC